jgi:hypothetical protein
MVLAAAVLYALHFVHLSADFPLHTPWMDWAKYTDEGWYGDAAIRHYTSGHWYFAGDFNPAVALPVWPALELVWFRFTGVSLGAARCLTVLVFGVTLGAAWWLMERHTAPEPRPRTQASSVALAAQSVSLSAQGVSLSAQSVSLSAQSVSLSAQSVSLAAPLVVLLLAASPYVYVFERMAILEPLMIALTLLALLAAGSLRTDALRSARGLWPAMALGVLLAAMVLTKTTAVFLMPAVAYMVWARAGYGWRRAVRLAWLPFGVGAALWMMYFFGFVRPHYLADYRYLFSANAYTGIGLQPLAVVITNVFADGMWMGAVVYALGFAVLAMAVFWRPRLLRNPLFSALLLWVAGYFAFMAYHNNLQPRYYLAIAVPGMMLVALGLDSACALGGGGRRKIAQAVVAACVLAMVVPDVWQMAGFVAHPTYAFRDALVGVAAYVREHPEQKELVLSISGSDLTLATGVPSIDDDFGVAQLGDRVQQYRPGWYLAWNELDDDKMQALTPLYTVQRVAAFAAYDDPERNQLVLYQLAAKPVMKPVRTKRLHLPRQLVTRLGQQPTSQQLQH